MEKQNKHSSAPPLEESVQAIVKIDEKKMYFSYGIVIGVIMLTLYFTALSGRIGSVEASQNALKSQYQSDISEIKTSMKTLAEGQVRMSNDVAVLKDRITRQ